jgi:competence protein ComFC
MWMITSFFSKILNIIFPKRCLKCKKEGNSLCDKCLMHCKKSIDIPNQYSISIYSFQDPLIKKAIHSIKYFHKKDLVESLTKNLTPEIETMISMYPSTTTWTLVPIPMPKLRKYIRGYNQAELIAKEIQKQIPRFDLNYALMRSRPPIRQVKAKTRGERLRNQHNSFITVENVENKHIIVIDDVTTTGATLFEARKVLLASGAKVVKTATLAH